MKLSQTTDEIFSVFGFGEGIDMMADAGFDAVDLAFYNLMCRDEFSEDNAEKTCEKILRRVRNASICVNQEHAPFPSC